MKNEIVPQVSKQLVRICVWPYCIFAASLLVFYFFGFDLRKRLFLFYYVSIFFVILGFIVGLTVNVKTVASDWKRLIIGFIFFGGGVVFLIYLIDQEKYFSRFLSLYVGIFCSFFMLIALAGLLAVHLKQLFRGD
jgi:hypothetical protein